MLIKNYDVLINEKEASCGLVINSKEYNINGFKGKDLEYEVDYDHNCIRVFSEKYKVTFCNADKRLLYYAFKTETLIIFVKDSPHGHNYHQVYEAVLA